MTAESMRPDDFFMLDARDLESSPLLRRELLQAILAGNAELGSDIDVADALVQLTHQEFEGYGTHGKQRLHDDDDVDLVSRAARSVCKRIGVEFPQLPFHNFSAFLKFWKLQGMSGSWAARRNYLDDAFRPTEEAMSRLQERTIDDALVDPVSPRGRTGWPEVDAEIQALRRRFDVASSPQDYSSVGTGCVRVLEAVADAAFDPNRDLDQGEPLIPRDKSKERLGRVVKRSLSGSEVELMRKLLNATIEVAHQVKHRRTPTRRDAGLATDAAIMVANLVRRLLT
jgi:hypothetical protein